MRLVVVNVKFRDPLLGGACGPVLSLTAAGRTPSGGFYGFSCGNHVNHYHIPSGKSNNILIGNAHSRAPHKVRHSLAEPLSCDPCFLAPALSLAFVRMNH